MTRGERVVPSVPRIGEACTHLARASFPDDVRPCLGSDRLAYRGGSRSRDPVGGWAGFGGPATMVG